MSYLAHLVVLINIYSILALSLNLLAGYAGLLSLCHAAFYGIGAYASTLLMMHLDLGFLPALALSVGVSVLLSLAISVPSLKLRGDYFVLASMAFQIIIFAVLYNWTDLTQGAYGIVDIPPPIIFGLEVNSVVSYLVFSGAVALGCALLLYLIAESPFGRVLKLIREGHEIVGVMSLGKDVNSFKVRAFAIAAGFAAVAGALTAGYVRYIDPTSFNLTESIFLVSVVIIGGAGNAWGPIAGAVCMILLPEALRLLQVPSDLAPYLRRVLYGGLIVLIIRFRPRGLVGEYRLE